MFKTFKEAVQKQFNKMKEYTLFTVEVDKDIMWDLYLASFPEGTNPMFRERTEHDCQCCKQFIRSIGNIVAIIDGKMVSIWDIALDNYYQEVADALSLLVQRKPIKGIYYHDQPTVGTDHSYEQSDSGTHKWEHFHVELPSLVIVNKDSIGTKQSTDKATFDVMYRGLSEITSETLELVIELVEQNSLHRGEEKLTALKGFYKLQQEFNQADSKSMFCWSKVKKVDIGISRIRNSAIGTLLVDLSDGKELNGAVASYENKVSGTNYKRSSSLVTPGMRDKAQKTVAELGLEPALHRRYASEADIAINDVLFADRDVRPDMQNSVFDQIPTKVTNKSKQFDKVEEIPIDAFIADILPTASSISVMVENSHINNMVSLIAPINPDSKPLFNWNNNNSWAYNGDVADSMKERVAKAGGKVDGILRYSIQWNEEGDNNIDFDAHCIEPNRNRIMYNNKRSHTSGRLDVDVRYPGGNIAVENITWTDRNTMEEGRYTLQLHNYSLSNSSAGFKAEIEYNGEVYSYEYPKRLKGRETVTVAVIMLDKQKGITFIESLPPTKTPKEIWGVKTLEFHKVSMVMDSPNYWGNNAYGNRQVFFMLDGCINKEKSRGFFNEFLRQGLHEHRKVFEILGSMMKTEESDKQLSGIGFSTTKRGNILCKVEGTFTRVIKLMF